MFRAYSLGLGFVSGILKGQQNDAQLKRPDRVDLGAQMILAFLVILIVQNTL